ncbi:GH39 family glycosyl hydrolase [Actinomadura sp. HBU206391]|uniref:GH39 family glycosyl hydrolase n=1 Tax=Actinomadura sp. HBU206391 TaxID=2731692 RepID=UPI001650D1D1|nr:glycosyl hydrolase [Actinomadura sp. HBU206391]MBC6460142.1 xylan 1,4-beta-xylosidase [Actinomadura sp. HBU206391]
MTDTTDVSADEARRDWQARIYKASGTAATSTGVTLTAPEGLHASAGVAQVSLTWEPVDGAAGYVVHRSDAEDGPFEPIRQRDVDVPAVPGRSYVDTGSAGTRWYAVAAIAAMNVIGPLSAPVQATPLAAPEGMPEVAVRVHAGRVTRPLPRPWRHMVGSEHLSHLLSTDTTGGRPIGAELTEALRIMHDDLGVYREVDDVPVHDFSGVGTVYDTITSFGMRPIVELSFMPRDLARDPSQTVFGYEAIISPPRDYDRWGDLVRALTAHLVARYGLEEVRDNWAFEVWNEANLEVFWSGTPEEFFRLYDVSAAAVKSVDPALRVGGPSSAANGWVDELLTHAAASGAAVDFVSTHTYGNAPLDWPSALARHGRAGTPIWWTEWGPTPTHFHGIGDGPFGAAFLLHGMRSAAGRVDSLSHWVASDHFEELGRPPALFHGGFGLLTVGNLRKPRFWALSLADRLGDEELDATVHGDVAGVEAWAARGSGRVGVLVWNGTLNQAQAGGEPLLDRSVTVTVEGLTPGGYEVRHHRVDDSHSNIEAAWRNLGGGDGWPTEAQWAELRAADTLDDFAPPERVSAHGEPVAFRFALPMPGVSYLEFSPITAPGRRSAEMTG